LFLESVDVADLLEDCRLGGITRLDPTMAKWLQTKISHKQQPFHSPMRQGMGYTLYLAAVDATTTFPSTDQPISWLKLFRLGTGGAIFDWLQMLYRQRLTMRNMARWSPLLSKLPLVYSLEIRRCQFCETSFWLI
jgi:hypothetical protein